MSRCCSDCVDNDDDGGTGDRTCTRCFASQSWTAILQGPVEKADPRTGLNTFGNAWDHFPPEFSDATATCGASVIGDRNSTDGFNSHVYSNGGVPAKNFRLLDSNIFTATDDPYNPPIFGNWVGDREFDPLFTHTFSRQALWGSTIQQHVTSPIGKKNVGNPVGGTEPVTHLKNHTDVELVGFYATSPDAFLHGDFEKTVSSGFQFDRFGGTDQITQNELNPLIIGSSDVVPDGYPDRSNFVTIAEQIHSMFGAIIAIGYFSGVPDFMPDGYFIDGYGQEHRARDLVDTVEHDRELFVRVTNPTTRPENQYAFLRYGLFYPTGCHLYRAYQGGFRITETITQTGYTPASSGGNFNVEYTHRIQVPTLLKFDESIENVTTTIGRCQAARVSAKAKTVVRLGFGGSADSRTINNELVENEGWWTLLSNNCSEQWSELINEGLRDELKRVQYCPAINHFSVDGTMTEEAGFRLQHARWNSSAGGNQSLDSFDDFLADTIPDNYVWDIGTGYVGDSLDLYFDNLGLVTVTMTGNTFTGSVITATNKTTDTFSAYQRKPINYTGPTGMLGINSQSTISVTHNESGNMIPSPFRLTIKLSGGAINPPP